MIRYVLIAAKYLPGKYGKYAYAGAALVEALNSNVKDPARVDAFVNHIVDKAADGVLSKADLIGAVNKLNLPKKG
jgi:hypothetical protein